MDIDIKQLAEELISGLERYALSTLNPIDDLVVAIVRSMLHKLGVLK